MDHLGDTLQAAPAIQGVACTACGWQAVGHWMLCGNCGARTLDPGELAPRGHVYSFTTIHLGDPTSASSYTLAYVDLTGGIRVLARMAPGSDAVLSCGAAVTLVDLTPNADGVPIMTFGVEAPGAGS